MQDVNPSSRASREVHFSTSEASASGPATIQASSVDAILTEHTVITSSKRKTSATCIVNDVTCSASCGTDHDNNMEVRRRPPLHPHKKLRDLMHHIQY